MSVCIYIYLYVQSVSISNRSSHSLLQTELFSPFFPPKRHPSFGWSSFHTSPICNKTHFQCTRVSTWNFKRCQIWSKTFLGNSNSFDVKCYYCIIVMNGIFQASKTYSSEIRANIQFQLKACGNFDLAPSTFFFPQNFIQSFEKNLDFLRSLHPSVKDIFRNSTKKEFSEGNKCLDLNAGHVERQLV